MYISFDLKKKAQQRIDLSWNFIKQEGNIVNFVEKMTIEHFIKLILRHRFIKFSYLYRFIERYKHLVDETKSQKINCETIDSIFLQKIQRKCELIDKVLMTEGRSSVRYGSIGFFFVLIFIQNGK